MATVVVERSRTASLLKEERPIKGSLPRAAGDRRALTCESALAGSGPALRNGAGNLLTWEDRLDEVQAVVSPVQRSLERLLVGAGRTGLHRIAVWIGECVVRKNG
jgi:hypothetical protein